MATLLNSPAPIVTLADLLQQLGGISPDRVRFSPPPGTASVKDVIEVDRRENRACELVDGVLVEKAMGLRESLLAAVLIEMLRGFVVPPNLGLVTGPDGTMRLFPDLVRIPDVAYISWGRIPGGTIPTEPVPSLVPDLAVEVLSAGNTDAEMVRKRREYFEAGVRLVWMVDPNGRTVTVYTGPDQSIELGAKDRLDGGDVLPDFSLSLHDMFAELDRRAKN